MKSPSPNGSNGERDGHGRFAKGNAGGPGNPHGRAVAKWRSLFLEAVSEQDLRDIVSMMIQNAKEGDINAAREILNRLIGRPAEALDPEKRSLAKRQLRLETRKIDVQEDAAIWRD